MNSRKRLFGVALISLILLRALYAQEKSIVKDIEQGIEQSINKMLNSKPVKKKLVEKKTIKKKPETKPKAKIESKKLDKSVAVKDKDEKLDKNKLVKQKKLKRKDKKEDKKDKKESKVKSGKEQTNTAQSDKNRENKDEKEKDKDNRDKKDEKKDRPIKKEPIVAVLKDSELRAWVKMRMPEVFYGRNIRLLNDDNPTDRIFYTRHTLDMNLEYRYGAATRGYDVIASKITIRNKGVWGEPETIAYTTDSEIKELEAVFGAHKHGIPRHILWVRELWMQICLSDFLCLPFCNYHTITFGAFPFELGRGIALGSAYALDPSDIGYISENSVDQYAFGGKISGDIVANRLSYDFYGAILNNKAASFDVVNAKIRGQEYGHRNDQMRGFGIINYIVAGRFLWTPVIQPDTKIRFEPYGLYNHNPEQKIEFLGDAISNLITLGFSGEFNAGNWEFGFDTAFNLGHQRVKGWDRNIVKLENRKGTVVVSNSRVRQALPDQMANATKSPAALYVSENQNIINDSIQSASQNGEVVGTNSLGTLINDPNRFTDPYINKFRGRMLVFDIAYNVCKPDLKVAGTYGFTSGDSNPNRDLLEIGDSEVDGVYDGFIGLQEAYSGVRVKSAFLLSSFTRIPRVLDFPAEEVLDPFPTTLSRFTNLLFVGAGFTWRPSWSCRQWSFNPNVFAFWQDHAAQFFDRKTRERGINRFAHQQIGVEFNAFTEAELLPDLKFFSIIAVFIPGKHYKDIKGRPLNKAQQAFLDNTDRTGILNDHVPLLGSDKAYFINFGLEFKF